eukprot:TRINITY_DN57112_c0_g1_i1.p1 TRINITY_DN57112_c0_g1~~TRINITY_DN57112_c0_g1_i1.p1  ORF type:complete len:340 (+),score=32.82 TRINITY_DN57112_c0_g1_i1:240-1259(+)
MIFSPSGEGSCASAVYAGIICAVLQLLGPDHLCTLMSLTSTESDWAAMKIGGAWGLAHCTGTVFVYVLLEAARSRTTIDLKMWEHYGDYIIGISLVLCAIYFIMRESDFIVERADGKLFVRACECHGTLQRTDVELDIPGPPMITARKKKRKAALSLSAAYSKKDCEIAGGEECMDANCGDIRHSSQRTSMFIDPEAEPLLGKRSDDTTFRTTWIGGTVMGLVQGVCCPMALVSINFITYVPTLLTMVAFLISYVTVSVIGAAVFSWVCSRLIANGIGRMTSPRVIYRGSCAFTLMFGVVWVAANAFDMVDAFDLVSFVRGEKTSVGEVTKILSPIVLK